MTDPTNPTGLDFANVASQIVTVTPQTAEAWLSRNTSNRPVLNKTVLQYTSDMAEGRWIFTGQSISFDRNGTLTDGQHRLLAQSRLGLTIDWNVITGLEPQAQDFMDIGRIRTIGNQLGLQGQKNGAYIGSISRLDLMYWGEIAPSKPAVLEHANASLNAFNDAAVICQRINNTLRKGSASAFGVAYFHMSAVSADLADQFAQSLIDGADMRIGHPILTVRNKILSSPDGKYNSAKERIELIDILHRAWNYWLTGKKVKSLATPTRHVPLINPEQVA